MIGTFLELSKLESKKIRLQALKLVLALEQEALAVFQIGRLLERELPVFDVYDANILTRYGRSAIIARLNEKFAAEHIGLANLDALAEQLGADAQSAPNWYRQGLSLLDCAHTLDIHVALYEYRLSELRLERSSEGRAPSVAHDYLATEQERWGRSDEQVTASLVVARFIPSRETYVASFRENVIKKHRLRRRERLEQNAP